MSWTMMLNDFVYQFIENGKCWDFTNWNSFESDKVDVNTWIIEEHR